MLTTRTSVALAIAAAMQSAVAADWPQFGYDGAHSGFNPTETAISRSNVAQLQSIYSGGAELPASVDSAPVYKSSVATANGTKNLLFLLSKNGRIMAVDAADGSVVWSHTTSGHQPTTASPAIDPGGAYVYAYGLDGMAHKYRIGDGTEITAGGWPQTITLKTDAEKVAGGFTIASSGGANRLVVVTDGYIGDGGDYQGHLVSIDLAGGTQSVFNAMCSDRTTHFDTSSDCAGVRSGIWGRGGATFDAVTDRVYVSTGNGQFNASTGGTNWGDGVLALGYDGSGAGGGNPRVCYTPSDFQHLQNSDIDLGSVGLAIVPPPSGSSIAHVGVQAGKDGVLHVINLDNMSGAGAPAHVGGELQLIDVPQGGNGFPQDLMREQPAVWKSGNTTWLFAGNGSGISGLQLGLDGSTPSLSAVWTKTGGANRSSSPVVANGVLFHAGTCGSSTCVNARNPATGDVLWSSETIGSLHWNSPIVVDGKIFIIDRDRTLWAFGLANQPDEIYKNGFDPT